MKTYLSILFCLFFIICSAKDSPKLKQFQKYLTTLNHAKYYSTSMAVSKYKELFAEEDLITRDNAFVLFDDFFRNVRDELNQVHLYDETDYSSLFNVYNNQDSIKSSNIILNYRKDLIENGFDIAMNGEGMTYIKCDRNFISRNFYSFISAGMKEYCTFYNIMESEGTVDDGALTISPRRIVERILWLEKFIEQNQNLKVKDDCKMLSRYFLYLLLNGTDNSPILEDNDEISNRFVDGFEFLTLEYPNSKLANYVIPFYNLLKNKQKLEANKLIEKYEKDKIIER